MAYTHTKSFHFLTEITCSFPGNPLHGFTSPARPTYSRGDKIKLDCKDGYVIEGPESLECELNGDFSDQLPTCERKSADGKNIFIKFINTLILHS